MSIFVYSDLSIKEKRVLTHKEHQSLIRKLQRGEIEDTMRSLKNYKLDETFEETLVILQLLESLCDSTRLGIIVEWTIRQMINEDSERNIQPIEYPIKPVIVGDKPPARRSHEKSESLRLDFFRYLISEKIANDSEGYFVEEKEQVEDYENMLSTSVEYLEYKPSPIIDVYCDRTDFVIDCDV